MAFAPITKLEKFTSEEDDIQTWINNITKAITANNWDDARTMQYHSLAQKPQNFNAFKTEFLRYFSDNNSINCLASTFTTLKQGDTKAVTTYLRCFHKNLHQIQAIQANYLTAPQILNQFIRAYAAAYSNEDFEAAELEANYTQAVNLVMNELSNLDSKLKQFNDSINQKLKGYLTDNCPIYQKMRIISKISRIHHYQQISCDNKNCEFVTTVVNKITLEPIAMLIVIHDREINIGIPIAATCNISITVINSLLITTINSNTTTKPSYDNIWKLQIQSNPKLKISNSSLSTDPQFNKSTIRITPAEFKNWNYLSLLIIPEDAASSKQKTNQKPLIRNIPPATSTENKSLIAIFLFELEEITSVLLFSRAALNTKPITMMYTDTKVDGQYIKLILDSGSAGSIITKQLINQLDRQVDQTASAKIITADGATKTPIGEIDDFSFEVNSIIVPIKVLTMQELQLSQNTMYDYFKTTNTSEAYQVSWANIDYNKLLLILAWDNDNKEKEKQREEHTWKITIDTWIDNNQSEMLPILDWKERNKGKGKKMEENILENTTTTEELTSGWEREYSHEPIKKPLYIPLKCKDCRKKLSSMGAWIAPDKDHWIAKASGTTNHVSLVANNYLTKGCETTFLVEEEHVTLYATAWHRAINQLNGYPHNENEIWQMANAKVQEAMPSEILEIKNNSPEQVDIIFIPNPDAFLDIETNSEDFHEHYQNLAPTREEQKQWLAQLNTPLCDHCLIPCDFQYCNDSCTLELESIFNPDSNSNNDDNKNTGFSSVQYSNEDNSNLDSNPNSKTFIVLLDLTKKQELKWFSDNNEDIMPEHVHDIDAGFNLRYPGKDTIKLELHLCICIDLKIALEILATTMIQLASRSSLAKREINIREKIIDAGYVGNIILVSVGNREELEITARGIQEFGSMGKVDIPVNMIEKKIIDKEEIISTSQPISISPYN
ncbi:hypothetical protein G9A89_018834 [Geosiphon pyriformis]|nr:hypothetical protein G9A89_018834 [Geosiphon pyriformis]